MISVIVIKPKHEYKNISLVQINVLILRVESSERVIKYNIA